jgi:hypothetical protein
MSDTDYRIDIQALNNVDEEIGKNHPRWSVNSIRQGISGRLKSKGATDGKSSDLQCVDSLYGHGSFHRCSNKRFGYMLEHLRLESQTPDSHPKVQLAIQLIAEILQEFQNLIHGDFFNFASNHSQGETGNNDSTPIDDSNPPEYRKEPAVDQSVGEIADMLQYIEELAPGFLEALRGNPDVNTVDDSELGQAVLLELLEELYEQIDLAIGRIAADDSSGQPEEFDRLQMIDDGVVDAIEGFKARIAGQINQIEAVSPGFSNKVRPFVEEDLDDRKESGSVQALQDGLEELSEVLEDVVALLNNNFEENNPQITDILKDNAEETAFSQKRQHDDATEEPSDSFTAQEKNVTLAPGSPEQVSEAAETFMVIYDLLSQDTKSEVAHILAGMAFDDAVPS